MKHNFTTYKESCLAFAQDTKKWYGLDISKFYTTDGRGGWDETSDNTFGGLDISWAFGLDESEISEKAPGMYARCILDLWRVCLENGEDEDGHYSFLDEFED